MISSVTTTTADAVGQVGSTHKPQDKTLAKDRIPGYMNHAPNSLISASDAGDVPTWMSKPFTVPLGCAADGAVIRIEPFWETSRRLMPMPFNDDSARFLPFATPAAARGRWWYVRESSPISP